MCYTGALFKLAKAPMHRFSPYPGFRQSRGYNRLAYPSLKAGVIKTNNYIVHCSEYPSVMASVIYTISHPFTDNQSQCRCSI